MDLDATADALRRLVEDAGLRRRMGESGRRRALEHLSWPVIIRAYDQLWLDQDAERQSHRTPQGPRPGPISGSAFYPAPEVAFAGHASAVLDGSDCLVADENALERLHWFLDLPLMNYGLGARTNRREIIRSIVDEASVPRKIDHLDAIFARAELPPSVGRSTLGWMIKYGLLKPIAAMNNEQ